MAKEKLTSYRELVTSQTSKLETDSKVLAAQEIHGELQDLLVGAMEQYQTDYDLRLLESAFSQLFAQMAKTPEYEGRRVQVNVNPYSETKASVHISGGGQGDRQAWQISNTLGELAVKSLRQLGVKISNHGANDYLVERSSLKSLVSVLDQIRNNELTPEQLREQLEKSEHKFEKSASDLFEDNGRRR